MINKNAVATAVKSVHQDVVDSLLLKRFGSLDDDLIQVMPNIIKLSPVELSLAMRMQKTLPLTFDSSVFGICCEFKVDTSA
jgi:hypothetical protein